MKKFLILCAVVLGSFRTYADEGMWLPQLLGKQVYDKMVNRGLKLTAEQLYSVNHSSIKDAIVIFGGGCTGEIVSNKGLIFTNHHCGYDAIASASSVEKNYLKDGFYAKSLAEEIPSAGLKVTFLESIEDVTAQILPALGTLSGRERMNKYSELVKQLTEPVGKKGKGYRGQIYSMFKGNQYLLYTYKEYNDVRLVGTPPESIGKYGGDTDNWEWPRHTGDFAVFRVYAGKNNEPADYSAENVPLSPKYHLPVSIKGVKEGDFSMIFGYPGSTNRYETSYGVKLKTDISNPAVVQLRDERLKLMFAEMKKDPATKLKLASDYAGIANYWKFFDGETQQLLKYKVFEQKQAAEAQFKAWAKGKPEFENIFTEWEKAYEAWRPFAAHNVYFSEGVMAPNVVKLAAALGGVEGGIKAGNADAAVKKFLTTREETLKETDLIADEKILATTLRMFYNNLDKSQHPAGFFENLAAKYGSLTEAATFEKYARDVYASTVILKEDRAKVLTADDIANDLAYQHYKAFTSNYQSKVAGPGSAFQLANNDLGRLYLKGIMQMDPKKAEKMYPDANFSMRVSYGNVKSYMPKNGKPYTQRDGIIRNKKGEIVYTYYNTMRGAMEKYKPGDYEFDLPQRFIDLYKKREFGQYADKRFGDVVVTFITTNDITGGNSGSPVLNAKGELIGLAFDGNYEALSHKLAFDKDLNRTICVDVRYVLWCIDVYGGAKNLIDELTLRK